MVSLESNNIKLYIKANTDKSLLLSTFCKYLFNNKLSENEIELLSKNNRDYKLIAAQGFSLNSNELLIEKFSTGIAWLIGRQFQENDNIIHENITLLGICVGLDSINNEDLKTKTEKWIKEIIEKKNKHSKQKPYANFFTKFLDSDSFTTSKSTIEKELSIFNDFLQELKPQTNLSFNDYYTKLRVRSFPYHEDDFFRNIINVYNENKIIGSYLLSQKDFSRKLELEKKNTFDEVISQLVMVLEKKAIFFADIAFVFFILFLVIFYSLITIFILTRDWNIWEPRTFLLSLPLLSYFFVSLYSWMTHKEFSIKPIIIFEKIKNWKLHKLLIEFNITDSNKYLILKSKNNINSISKSSSVPIHNFLPPSKKTNKL